MKHCLIKSKLYIFHIAILLIFTHRHIRKLCIKTCNNILFKYVVRYEMHVSPPPEKCYILCKNQQK